MGKDELVKEECEIDPEERRRREALDKEALERIQLGKEDWRSIGADMLCRPRISHEERRLARSLFQYRQQREAEVEKRSKEERRQSVANFIEFQCKQEEPRGAAAREETWE